MIYKNILYKEWKAHRKASFLTILGGILAVLLWGRGIGEKVTYVFLWPLYSVSLLGIFASEARTGFLDARPISRTHLWVTKNVSACILWCVTIFLTLTGHFLILKSRNPSFSVLSILLDPSLLLIQQISLALYFGLQLFWSIGQISKNILVGTCLAVYIAIYWFLKKHLGLIAYFNPPDFRHETLALFISLISSLLIFGTASYLIFVHRETFSTAIRRRKISFYFASSLIIVIFAVTLRYLLSIPLYPKDIKFIHTISTSSDGKIIVFSAGRTVIPESQLLIIDNTGTHTAMFGNRFSRCLSLVGGDVVYRSDSWLYGPAIWVSKISDSWENDMTGGYVPNVDNIINKVCLSENDYQHKVSLGEPYLSPDKDRIAYVMQVSRWGGTHKKNYVTIASLDGFIVPYQVCEQKDFDISPVGWTPDGNYFYFRKTASGSVQEKQDALMAIDKNAQNIETIIDNFSSYFTGPYDFAEDGNWVSMVSKQKDGYMLWIMNTLTKKMIQVDSSETGLFTRAWSIEGKHFAYVKPAEKDKFASDLCILDINGVRTKTIVTKRLPEIVKLKWSPDGKHLLLRTLKHGEENEKLEMVDIAGTGQAKTILSELPFYSRYTWFGNDKIVYADKGRLITIDIAQARQTQLFPSRNSSGEM